MEIAIREQAKIAEAGAGDKVRIETLEAELTDIDNDIKQSIAEIRATPIDKKLLRKQAESDRDNRLRQNDLQCKFRLNNAELAIKQAEYDAESEYKQAKLDIEKKRSELSNLKESVTATKEQQDIAAQQDYEKIIASVDNTEKTIELRINKVEIEGKKRKKDIEIQLRSLKARNNVVEEQKSGWKQFYKDTVEISMIPPKD